MIADGAEVGVVADDDCYLFADDTTDSAAACDGDTLTGRTASEPTVPFVFIHQLVKQPHICQALLLPAIVVFSLTKSDSVEEEDAAEEAFAAVLCEHRVRYGRATREDDPLHLNVLLSHSYDGERLLPSTSAIKSAYSRKPNHPEPETETIHSREKSAPVQPTPPPSCHCASLVCRLLFGASGGGCKSAASTKTQRRRRAKAARSAGRKAVSFHSDLESSMDNSQLTETVDEDGSAWSPAAVDESDCESTHTIYRRSPSLATDDSSPTLHRPERSLSFDRLCLWDDLARHRVTDDSGYDGNT